MHRALKTCAVVLALLVLAAPGVCIAQSQFGITPSDGEVLEVSAFDAARALIEERAVLGPVVTGRIRDVAAIPGLSR